MSNFGRPEEKSGVAFREGGKDNGGRTPTTKTALLPGSPSPSPLAAIAASPIHCLLLCLRPLPVAFDLSVGERPNAKTDLSDGDCLSNKMTKNRIVQSFKDNP